MLKSSIQGSCINLELRYSMDWMTELLADGSGFKGPCLPMPHCLDNVRITELKCNSPFEGGLH